MSHLSAAYHNIVLPLVPQIRADLLWDLSALFVGLGLLYFLCAFYLRNRLAHKSRAISHRKKELGPMISNFLFFGDDASLQEKYDYVQMKLEIRQLLKDNFNRKVMVEVLLDLQKDIAGDARIRLFALYRNLGLHLDAFEKLKSWRWEVISQGILELTQLQVEESYGFIKKFINHRRGVIRKQAQMATVSLKHEGIIYFLDTCKYKISEWQQLKLLDVIRNLEDFQPPRFKAWLTSKNKDVVLFSLRLIKYYKQNDANNSLIELVKHKNDEIKAEAIHCIKEFCVFDAMDTLKAMFWNCSDHVKLLLLDAIADLGSEEEISFLKQVEQNEGSFMVRSKALGAINTIAPDSIMPTHDIETTIPYEDQMAAQEADMEQTSKKQFEMVQKSRITQEEEIVSGEDDFNEVNVVPDENTNELLDVPVEWEELLDTETEDENIFELCFMEELEDILVDATSTVQGVLPLDFLPIVEGIAQPEEEHEPANTSPNPLLDMEVEAEVVHENEKFSIELNSILHRIRENRDGEEEMAVDFIPLVTEATIPTDMDKTKKISTLQLNEMEVYFEEVIVSQILPADNTPRPSGADGKDKTARCRIDGIEVTYEQVPGAIPRDAGEIDLQFEPEEKAEALTGGNDVDPASAEVVGYEEVTDRASIFYELFRTLDSESKLILLDEVLAVGEARELHFLESLKHDENRDVRTKAAKIKVQLEDFLLSSQQIGNTLDTKEKEVDKTDDVIAGTDTVTGETQIEEAAPNEMASSTEPLENCFLMDGSDDPTSPFDIFKVDFELIMEESYDSHTTGNIPSFKHHR